MPDPNLLRDWFTKIDEDVRFLCDCFAEVLNDLNEPALAEVLPWRTGSEQAPIGTISPRVDRELQALAISYHLLNLVEEIAAVQARRDRVTRHGLFHEPGLWGHAIRTRAARGESAEHIAEALRDVNVEVVLTAHPTEAKRPLVLRQHRALFDAFWELQNFARTPDERSVLRERIKVILERLWRTGEMYLVKPDVQSELRYVLDYFAAIFPTAIEEVQRRLKECWSAFGLPLDAIDAIAPAPRLTFGNWVGGDRDGHPLVTADVTNQALHRMRWTALDGLRRKLLDLSNDVSFSDFFQDAPLEFLEALRERRRVVATEGWSAVRELPHEPWREFARHVLAGIERALSGDPGGYPSPEAVASDLRVLKDALNAMGANRIARAQIDPILGQLDAFGFHLAAMDIRQNSSYYSAAMDQLLKAAGLPDFAYSTWSYEKRAQFLDSELKSLRPLAPRHGALGPEARGTLECFSVVAEGIRLNGPACIGSFIVSMTQHATDLLAVYVFAREVGLLTRTDAGICSELHVVPLFETVRDLEQGCEILRAFLTHPVTMNSLNARRTSEGSRPLQQIMVGYSDSNKDAGIFASQWTLHRAQRSLSATARECGVDPLFFHGRGGTFSRGAGPTHRFLESLPAETVSGHIRVTEQGEMIAQKFANLPTAVFNLELMLAGVAATTRRPETTPAGPEFEEVCVRLSEFSAAAYRALIAGEGFLEFWAQATPIDALENSFIGSRPARRSGRRTLEDLRAIPWVFGWAQSRYYLPGWYGVGSGLERLQRETPALFEALKRNIAAWPFVQYVLYNAETSLASADPDLMREYAELVEDPQIRQEQFDRIGAEYGRSVQFIEEIFGSPRRVRRPRLMKTLDMRACGLRLMHRRQLELLRQWRALRNANDEAAAAELFPTLLLSINGIASAERTTG